MRTILSKRNGIGAAAFILVLTLVGFGLFPRSERRVTLLNQGFRVLTARSSYGTTHKLYFARWPEGELREQFHHWGLKVQRSGGVQIGTGKASYAFMLRYTGQLARNELDQVRAEIVDDSGVTAPVHGAESYNPTKNEFARIWEFEHPPTNTATLRLSLATSGVRLAEIRIGGRNVR